MKAAGRVENAEITPSSRSPSIMGTQSIERMPSRSSMSRRAERESARTSSTRIGTPAATQLPMIPSPTGISSADHSFVRKPCAAAWMIAVPSLFSSPMPHPVEPISAVTDRLIRSSTDARSSRPVMSWLVA